MAHLETFRMEGRPCHHPLPWVPHLMLSLVQIEAHAQSKWLSRNGGEAKRSDSRGIAKFHVCPDHVKLIIHGLLPLNLKKKKKKAGVARVGGRAITQQYLISILVSLSAEE